MCQILGISNVKPEPWNKAWDKFRQRAAGNPDGWGIAYGDVNGLAVVKQPDRADRSALAAALGKVVLPAPVMIGHVRLASRGSIALTNTHPFFANVNGRDWAMVHNGHLNSYGFTPGQHGQTDSEAFFLRLLELIERTGDGDPYSIAELFAAEAGLAGRYGKLNIILTDGEYLFVHTNKPASLHHLQGRNSVCICSQPISLHRGWKPLDTNKVHVFKAGEFIYRTQVRATRAVKKGSLWCTPKTITV